LPQDDGCQASGAGFKLNPNTGKGRLTKLFHFFGSSIECKSDANQAILGENGDADTEILRKRLEAKGIWGKSEVEAEIVEPSWRGFLPRRRPLPADTGQENARGRKNQGLGVRGSHAYDQKDWVVSDRGTGAIRLPANVENDFLRTCAFDDAQPKCLAWWMAW
jgi:hypothetical protein